MSEDDAKRGWLLAAVLLYESLGFVTLGTAPGAFRHPLLGPVGLRIMWLDLRHPANATN